MILVNQRQLNVASASRDKDDEMYVYAMEYEKGLKELRKRFPEGTITFVRPGYPQRVDGITAKGKEVRDIPYPTAQARYPLKTNFTHPERGTELWACCLDAPKILPGNLWDLGTKRSFTVEERLHVDINKEPDFAFYLVYRSKAVLGGHLKIDDPKAELKEKADKERKEIERKTAIWTCEDAQLRKMCQAYGVSDAMKKDPNALRFEIQDLLKKNDELQLRDASIKGTREFLDEMNITDNVRLRAFVRNAIDTGVVSYKMDGRYKVGARELVKVPKMEINRKFDYLCNYLGSAVNADELRTLMVDVINKEYLETVEDEKDLKWIAKAMDLEGWATKSADKIKEAVYGRFVV